MAWGSNDFDISFADVFDPCYENDPSSLLSSRAAHTKNCKVQGDTSVNGMLEEIIAMNPSVLKANSHFVRRRNDMLCYCTEYKYEISLRNSSIKCVGCGRHVRSSKHTCKTYDLFRKNSWLGKHQTPLYREVRRKNFVLLANMLPYILPVNVLKSCDVVSYCCLSVNFLDTVVV